MPAPPGREDRHAVAGIGPTLGQGICLFVIRGHGATKASGSDRAISSPWFKPARVAMNEATPLRLVAVQEREDSRPEGHNRAHMPAT